MTTFTLQEGEYYEFTADKWGTYLGKVEPIGWLAFEHYDVRGDNSYIVFYNPDKLTRLMPESDPQRTEVH